MYVCHCKVVSEQKVREAIAAGAHTVEQIGEHCGAGTRCFGCHPLLREMLAEHGIDDSRTATSL